MNEYSEDPYEADEYLTSDDGPAIPRISGIPHARRSPESLQGRIPIQRDDQAQ